MEPEVWEALESTAPYPRSASFDRPKSAVPTADAIQGHRLGLIKFLREVPEDISIADLIDALESYNG